MVRHVILWNLKDEFTNEEKQKIKEKPYWVGISL